MDGYMAWPAVQLKHSSPPKDFELCNTAHCCDFMAK